VDEERDSGLKKINKIMGRDEGRDRGYFRERVC